MPHDPQYRIVIFSDCPYFAGGAEVCLFHVIADPTLIPLLVVPDEGEIAEEARRRDIPVAFVKMGAVSAIRRPFRLRDGIAVIKDTVKAAIGLNAAARLHGAICVHTNGLKAHGIACFGRLLGGPPVVPYMRCSPYTAVGHQRVMDLVARSGVTLKLRPVMPMMMRGIPAPREKQMYIISDAKRESAAARVRFGNFVDPFGEPVKKAFALYPWIARQGKAEAYVTAYLSAAWATGIDICSDAGLQQVIESIGLRPEDAFQHMDNDEWQPLLEDNVQAMLAENLWGVPSFRVTGGSVVTSFACWGQDRIWRVESEISRRAC